MRCLGTRARRGSWLVGLLAAGLLASLALAGCGASADPSTSSSPVRLTVFAAASLTEAFTAMASPFQAAHPEATVTYNFGGSDTLATQIAQGAPADVFASANSAQMDALVADGQVAGASVATFAHNRLVVIYPRANPAGLTKLQDLARPGVKVDLAADTVPVGHYAFDFLSKASADPAFGPTYKAAVLKNVVSYETDVKVVLAKVSLGEADAGIVYTTDAATKADAVGTLDIPDALNSVAVYPIAPVKGSAHAALAAQFVAYVGSSDGQAILARYGFLPGAGGPQYTPPAR